MIETAMKISEQFENFSKYTSKEMEEITQSIKQRKTDCEQQMAALERMIHIDKATLKGRFDSTCVLSDNGSQDGGRLRPSDFDQEGKKKAKAFRDHIHALKEHIRKTDEYLMSELNAITPRIKQLKETLNS
jgi:hypothetical protein